MDGNDEFVRPAERRKGKKGLRFFFQRRNKYKFICESGGRKIVAQFPVHSLVKDDELNLC